MGCLGPRPACCVCCGCARCRGPVCDTCRRSRLRLPRQPSDHRDYVWHAGTPLTSIASLPRRFLLPGLPPALNQKNFAACAANACAAAINYAMTRHGVPGFRASRMFLYYNTRRHVMKVGNLADDCGSNLRDTCKALARFGVCPEDAWPYRASTLQREPPASAYQAARRLARRCTYESVPQTLHHMLPCLVHHHPVLMGMAIFSNVRGVHEDGVLPMPGPGDSVLGVHAVLVCGFDLAARRFTAMNCWGGEWGDRGLFYIPFEFVLTPGHCWDLWILNFDEKTGRV